MPHFRTCWREIVHTCAMKVNLQTGRARKWRPLPRPTSPPPFTMLDAMLAFTRNASPMSQVPSSQATILGRTTAGTWRNSKRFVVHQLRYEMHSWMHLEQTMSVSVKRLSQRSIEFDMVGVDASIANAFRRVMISEVSSTRAHSPSACPKIPSRFQQWPSKMSTFKITPLSFKTKSWPIALALSH